MPNFERAMHAVVHDIGVPAVAIAISKTEGTVYNKANEGFESQGFMVAELRALSAAHHDYRGLQALCEDLQHIAVPVGDFTGTSDTELLDLHLQTVEDFGELGKVLRDSLQDGRIDADEAEKFQEAAHRLMQSTLALNARVEGMAR